MENWGLVTYRETKLLYDPETSSIRNKEATATIIAHELAHMVTGSDPSQQGIDPHLNLKLMSFLTQWFGNLVTLNWWNEVWLNEGFASYVAYLGADHAEPAWNVVRRHVDMHVTRSKHAVVEEQL